MAVGGLTTVPSWIQALESKYWNMCLFLYMCCKARWWAHPEDGNNNNSHFSPASRGTTVLPEPHLEESDDHLDDTSFLPFVQCHQPTRPLLKPCFSHSNSPSYTFSFEGAQADGSSQFFIMDLFQGHACISGSFFFFPFNMASSLILCISRSK